MLGPDEERGRGQRAGNHDGTLETGLESVNTKLGINVRAKKF